jgi:hypothetical protein
MAHHEMLTILKDEIRDQQKQRLHIHRLIRDIAAKAGLTQTMDQDQAFEYLYGLSLNDVAQQALRHMHPPSELPEDGETTKTTDSGKERPKLDDFPKY